MTAGEEIIREGEVGRRFYVILEGEVLIHQAGVLRRRLGAGEYFGEIALLRDVPRTADVTADTGGQLLVLDREGFLSAVTGHARWREAADETIAERLREPDRA